MMAAERAGVAIGGRRTRMPVCHSQRPVAAIGRWNWRKRAGTSRSGLTARCYEDAIANRGGRKHKGRHLRVTRSGKVWNPVDGRPRRPDFFHFGLPL
jgi:hypothetical protein